MEAPEQVFHSPDTQPAGNMFSFEAYHIELDKPVGIRFAKSPLGHVVVGELDPHGPAAESKLVAVGDIVRSVSSVFGSEMWDAEDFSRVLYAIRNRCGNSVHLVLERPTPAVSNEGGASPATPPTTIERVDGISDDDDDPALDEHDDAGGANTARTKTIQKQRKQRRDGGTGGSSSPSSSSSALGAPAQNGIVKHRVMTLPKSARNRRVEALRLCQNVLGTPVADAPLCAMPELTRDGVVRVLPGIAIARDPDWQPNGDTLAAGIVDLAMGKTPTDNSQQNDNERHKRLVVSFEPNNGALRAALPLIVASLCRLLPPHKFLKAMRDEAEQENESEEDKKMTDPILVLRRGCFGAYEDELCSYHRWAFASACALTAYVSWAMGLDAASASRYVTANSMFYEYDIVSEDVSRLVNGATNDMLKSGRRFQHIASSHKHRMTSELKWCGGGKHVQVAGDVLGPGGWSRPVSMMPVEPTIHARSPTHVLKVSNLPPGTYRYKYVVDEEWTIDDSSPVADDGHYNFNNVLDVRIPNELGPGRYDSAYILMLELAWLALRIKACRGVNVTDVLVGNEGRRMLISNWADGYAQLGSRMAALEKKESEKKNEDEDEDQTDDGGEEELGVHRYA